MDEDRAKHSLAVAKKMVEIGKRKNLSQEKLDELFMLGYVHDIGYQFLDEEHTSHNEEGAKRLKEAGYKYWQEVKYHGYININYHSEYLDILNEADMQIDKFGNDVGYDKRLEDIKNRYGEESRVYNVVKTLVSNLRAKEKDEGR